jgi:ElaA protein
MIHKHVTEFNKLSPADVYNILKLRQDVFIIEQNCIYDDIDGIDLFSEHVMIYDENILAAYSRIVPAGAKFDEISIGRIVVHPQYRGMGLGKEIVNKSLDILGKREAKCVTIEAQCYLENFYRSLGFEKISEPYDVDGIPHIEMSTDLNQ